MKSVANTLSLTLMQVQSEASAEGSSCKKWNEMITKLENFNKATKTDILMEILAQRCLPARRVYFKNVFQ